MSVTLINEHGGTLETLLRDALILADQRLSLCKKQPPCPKCKTRQVQLIDVSKQAWKCRECKHKFFTSLDI